MSGAPTVGPEMKPLMITLGFMLAGCQHPVPVQVSAAPGPKAAAVDSALVGEVAALKDSVLTGKATAASAAGNVYGAQKALAAVNPEQPAKSAAGQELELAQQKLPAPSAEDQLAAEKRVTAILSGKLEEAAGLYKTATAEANAQKAKADLQARDIAERDAAIQKLHADAEAERAANAATLKKAFDDKDAALAKVKSDYERKLKSARDRWVTGIFFGLGGLLVAGGIVVLLTATTVPMFGPRAGFALVGAGAGLIGFGIAINQAENFLDAHQWITGLGLGVVAMAAVAGLILMYANHQHHLASQPQPIKS